MDNFKCPIWGTDADLLATSGDRKEVISNRAGGHFSISGSALAMIGSLPGSKRVALSEFVFLSNRQGSVPVIDTALLHDVTDPEKLSPIRKLDRLLVAICESFPAMGSQFNTREVLTGPNGEFFAASVNSAGCIPRDYAPEVGFLIEALLERGFLQLDENNPVLAKVTLSGWQKFEDLGVSVGDSSQIFIAMWFGSDEQSKIYLEAIKPAIEAAGYAAVRIDNTEHNDKIDDRIISEIRKSKALVVDLTCGLARPEGEWSRSSVVGAPRGGVFYEAGFAAGLGLPVIWTVKSELSDVENVVHFDVRQFNQIRWQSDLSDFRTRLQLRIEATLGRGPLFS